MKMRKVISTVLAGVLALSALPISAMSAGAEGAYAPGDVDMDGFVTAHDAAVVSRALYVDNNLLTSEQKKLADVNGDGKITQEDADWIHENQVYNLGQLDESSDHLDSTGIFYQFYYVARKGAGVPFEVVDKSEKLPENLLGSSLGKDLDNSKMPQLFFNLLDVDGDGSITVNDIYASVFSCALCGAGLTKENNFVQGRYDLNADLINVICEEDESGSLAYSRDHTVMPDDIKAMLNVDYVLSCPRFKCEKSRRHKRLRIFHLHRTMTAADRHETERLLTGFPGRTAAKSGMQKKRKTGNCNSANSVIS